MSAGSVTCSAPKASVVHSQHDSRVWRKHVRPHPVPVSCYRTKARGQTKTNGGKGPTHPSFSLRHISPFNSLAEVGRNGEALRFGRDVSRKRDSIKTRSGPNRPAAAIGGVIFLGCNMSVCFQRLDFHLLWTNHRRIRYIFGYVLLIFFCHRVLKCQEI